MSLSCRFDYLQGTGFISSRSDFQVFIERICDFLPIGDSFEFLNHGLYIGQSFDTAFRSVRGKLYGGIRQESDKHKYLLQIPGTYCSQLGNDGFLPLINFLTDSNFNFTRVDIAVDDYSRSVSFDDVKKAGELGNFRLVETYKCIESSLMQGMPLMPTCYFGNSDKILRFYDAFVVHGISADRWELQLRDDHARIIISDYLLDQSFLPGLVFGSVDFGSKGENWYQFERFKWWESLISEAGNVFKISLPSVNPCFERSLKWLKNQVSPTLAVAHAAYGEEAFNSLINELVSLGYQRLKPYHDALITEVQKDIYEGLIDI